METKRLNTLFIYNPADLNAEIPGGVQVCSQKYQKLVEGISKEMSLFEVHYNKSFKFRALYKANLAAYQSYQPKDYLSALTKLIKEKKITHVFLNKAELLCFSKIIKSSFSTPPKIIILSHGNESGDLLGDLTSKSPTYAGIKRLFGIWRLGLSLYKESFYRKRYLDFICTLSSEERAIEKWLGMNDPIYFPYSIVHPITVDRKPNLSRFGYIGTLNHSPNVSGLIDLFNSIDQSIFKGQIRIIGGPTHIGDNLQEKYPFVEYVGHLTNTALINEIKTWGFFLNPTFYYARGASMKLAKAIEFEIPVITTHAGRRGYDWLDGHMIEVDESPRQFAAKMEACQITTEEYAEMVVEIKKIKNSSPSLAEQSATLLEKLTVQN